MTCEDIWRSRIAFDEAQRGCDKFLAVGSRVECGATDQTGVGVARHHANRAADDEAEEQVIGGRGLFVPVLRWIRCRDPPTRNSARTWFSPVRAFQTSRVSP